MLGLCGGGVHLCFLVLVTRAHTRRSLIQGKLEDNRRARHLNTYTKTGTRMHALRNCVSRVCLSLLLEGADVSQRIARVWPAACSLAPARLCGVSAFRQETPRHQVSPLAGQEVPRLFTDFLSG